MKNKFSIAMSLAVVLAMLVTSMALADTYSPDNDVFSPGNQSSVSLSASPGATVTTSAQIVVDWQGSKHLAAGSSVTFAVNTSQTNLPSGYTVGNASGTVPSPWDSTDDYFTAVSNISFTAPSSAGTYSYTVKWDDISETCATTGGDCLTGANDFTINLEVTAPTNTAPSVNAGGPYSGSEGSAISLDGTVSDPDGDSLTTTWTYTVVSADAGASCSFGDASAVDTAITCNDNGTYTATLTADDGQGHSVNDSATVTVANANPVVAAPSWSSSSVACRASANLTGISFSDAGTIDNPWDVNIDWGDGSTDTSYNASAQGAQSNQSHTYNMPGNYSATVSVTDKDGGSGSNTSGSLTVLQSYTVNFLQPFDNSSPSQLITNTMKSGRVVPVKVTIYDDCAQAYVTDPSAAVKIFLSAGTTTGGSNDAVEVYADAGASNSNTLYFRWTADSTAPGGGFWIYNLDSRTALNGAALAIGTTYRVDVFVGTAKATTTKWALLKPVK